MKVAVDKSRQNSANEDQIWLKNFMNRLSMSSKWLAKTRQFPLISKPIF